MNAQKIIELFKTGAVFYIRENTICHPSFRKGFRKLTISNISLVAAERILGDDLVVNNGIMKLASTSKFAPGKWILGTDDDNEGYEYIPSAAELS